MEPMIYHTWDEHPNYYTSSNEDVENVNSLWNTDGQKYVKHFSIRKAHLILWLGWTKNHCEMDMTSILMK
jgi:hypothetical protein